MQKQIGSFTVEFAEYVSQLRRDFQQTRWRHVHISLHQHAQVFCEYEKPTRTGTHTSAKTYAGGGF